MSRYRVRYDAAWHTGRTRASYEGWLEGRLAEAELQRDRLDALLIALAKCELRDYVDEKGGWQSAVFNGPRLKAAIDAASSSPANPLARTPAPTNKELLCEPKPPTES